jgi:hypothetical protein
MLMMIAEAVIKNGFQFSSFVIDEKNLMLAINIFINVF